MYQIKKPKSNLPLILSFKSLIKFIHNMQFFSKKEVPIEWYLITNLILTAITKLIK